MQTTKRLLLHLESDSRLDGLAHKGLCCPTLTPFSLIDLVDKMPKKILKIGERLTAGDDLHMKRFTNGHKCFTASEARAITECQRSEKRTADFFEVNKHTMIRGRDPLIDGEVDIGELILNPYAGQAYIPTKKEVTLKVGMPEPDKETGLQQHHPELRTESLRYLQDNITGELEYIKMKLERTQTSFKNSIIQNKTFSLARSKIR